LEFDRLAVEQLIATIFQLAQLGHRDGGRAGKFMDVHASRCAQIFEQSAVFCLPNGVVHVVTMSKVTRTDAVREITLIVIQTDSRFKQKPDKTNKSFQCVAKALQVMDLSFQV
jgi:hypothetical protein